MLSQMILKRLYNHIAIDDIPNYLMVIYALSIPLGHALANIEIALILAWILFELYKGKIVLSHQNKWWMFLFGSYFIIYAFSLLFSENWANGISLLMRKSMVLIFALFFFISKVKIKEKFIHLALMGYTVSVFFVCVVSFAISVLGSDDFVLKHVSADNFANAFISYHKLYLALYVVLAIYFLNFVLKNKFIFPKVLTLIINGLFLITLLVLGSRTQLMLAILLLAIVPLIVFIREKEYIKVASIFLLLISITAVNIIHNPVLVEKAKEMVNYEDQYNIKKKWGGAAVRKLIWEYAGYVALDNLVFGVGIGDVQKELEISYLKCTESSALQQNNYNAHNDMLQIVIGTGLIGFILFVLAQGYIFNYSFHRANYFYCGVILLFFLSGLTESYLERDMGIRVFAFFPPMLFLLRRE